MKDLKSCWPWISFILVSIAVFLCTCLFLLVSIGSHIRIGTAPQPPERNFDLEDLFITESAFPQDWEIVDVGLPYSVCVAAPLGSGCRSYNAKGLSFYYRSGLASQEIHAYLSQDRAASDFRRLQKEEFWVDEFSTPWIAPAELSYQSPIADQFYLLCHTHRGVLECKMLGQYREFVVLFHTDMVSKDYKGLRSVLQAIDERVISCLY